MSRNPERDLIKSWGAFDTTYKLCKNAIEKNSSRRFSGLLETLEKTYYDFDADWRLYKEDTIKKTCKSEEAFNATEEIEGVTVAAFKFNDSWSGEQLLRYADIRDTLEDSLDQVTAASGVDGSSVPQAGSSSFDADFATDEIKSDMQSIKSSIVKLKTEIEGYEDETMPSTINKGYENLLSKLENKAENEFKAKVMTKLASSRESSDSAYSNVNLRVIYKEFNEFIQAELSTCSMLLIKKCIGVSVEEKPATDITVAAVADSLEGVTVGSRPREQVFLEKTKPPRFTGDDVEYPEFKRKWSSQVNKANLPEETELDKLRDSLPRDAKDQLYGVLTLTEAWQILDKRFGDKQLIAKKLKSQLKSIQCVGKSDPEKIINLKIKVRNIVTRLEQSSKKS